VKSLTTLLGVAIVAGFATGCGADNKPLMPSPSDVESQKPGEALRLQNEALRKQNGYTGPSASAAQSLAGQNAAQRQRNGYASPGRR
jgi:hypothetical protein